MQGLTVRLPRGPDIRLIFARVRTAALLAAATALLVPAFVPLPAGAQQARSESVDGRVRPEYDPLGLRLDDALTIMSRIVTGDRRSRLHPDTVDALSSFLLKTRMDFVVEQDDNIFREPNNEVSDTVFKFRPRVDVNSDWSNHALNLSLDADFGRYASNESEDYNDFKASVGGKVDIDEGDVLNVAAEWSLDHEPRDSRDDVDGPEPTKFRKTSVSATYNHDAGEIFSRTTLSWSYIDFDDTGNVNNDDRDRWTYDAKQRFGHDIDEGSQAFVEGTFSYRDYRLKFDDNGREQGSYVAEGLAGMTWDASGVTFAEVAAGYLFQDFKDPTLRNESSFSFRGRVLWNVTGLVTFGANFGREAKETSRAGASSELESTYGVTLDWEALYNLIVTAEGRLTQVETRGLNEEEDTHFVALRTRWLIDDHWRLTGAVEHEVRESTAADDEFSSTRFVLTLTERL